MATKNTKTELLVKINNLEQKIKEQDEIMYDKGIKTHKTMMTDIELVESDTRNYIEYSIKECEKRTGRELTNAIEIKINKKNFIENHMLDGLKYNMLDGLKYHMNYMEEGHKVFWKKTLNNILKQSTKEQWSGRQIRYAIKDMIENY